MNALYGRATSERGRRTRRRECLLDSLAGAIHTQTRHGECAEEHDEVEDLVVPFASEERTPPARGAPPGVTRVVDRGVEAHLETGPEERRERVCELHNADCGDETGDSLYLGDGGTHDKRECPI